MSDNNSSLILLSKANQMLAECKTIDDVKDLMDKAATAKFYARKHKLGKEAVGHAREIEIRAEILLGEFLKEMEKNKGGKPVEQDDRLNNVINQDDSVKPPTYKNLGLTRDLASESQRLADLPEDEKEKVISGKMSNCTGLRFRLFEFSLTKSG